MTPLFVCSAGPYQLRGRPFMVGIPLEDVATVQPLGALMPFPGTAPGLIGLTEHEGGIIPVYSPSALLGLDDRGERSQEERVEEAAPRSTAHSSRGGRRYLAIVRGAAGWIGLTVSHVAGTARPLHWADPAVLAPISCPAIVGALPLRERWIAVLDPSRLATVRQAA
jgi:chemotaxis signal transduction protein